MAEASRFWTTSGTGDGPSGGYSAALFGQFVRETFITDTASEGVLRGIGNNLAVTGSASPVAVNTGSALVYGFFYSNDSSVNVTIPTPTTATRIDRIVLRASWSAQTIRITRIAGTEGGGAPALTQTANTTWDIPLAQASITTGGVITLTDQRTYVKHPGVYGWLDENLSIRSISLGTATAPSEGWAFLRNDGSPGGPQIAFSTTGTGAPDWRLGIPGTSNADDFFLLDNSSGGAGTVMWIDRGTGNIGLGGNTSPAAKLDVTGGITASGTINGTIGTNGVPTAAIQNNAVTTAKIADANVTTAKIADANVTTAKIADANVTTAKIADANVTTAKIADDAVDDTKIGNRVPQFFRRQGGSPNSYSNAGTTTYIPGAVRMQGGTATLSWASSQTSATAITFPVSFSFVPLVFVTIDAPGSPLAVMVNNISQSGFDIRGITTNDAIWSASYNVYWLAIGPE